jgi:hypothetical protein
MFKRNCVVKYVDSFGVEHAAKVEAKSLFEAAVRGLARHSSPFGQWTNGADPSRFAATVGRMAQCESKVFFPDDPAKQPQFTDCPRDAK